MGRRVFALLLALLFIYIASPLIVLAAMAAVLAVLLFPMQIKLEKWKLNRALSSGILTFGITVLVLLPTAVLIYLGAKFGLQQIQALKAAPPGSAPQGDWIENLMINPRFEALIAYLPISKDQIASGLQDLAASIGLKVADLLGALLAALPGMVMGLFIIVVSIYFFLVDGEKWVTFSRRNSFFRAEETDQLLHNLAVMCRSVILATVVSGSVQSSIYTVACLSVGTGNPLLIGFLVFLASFVPLIGSAPITFGVAIHQFFIGNTVAGIILAVVATFVGVVDNFIRPWFLKGSANIHPLLAFLAALGGLQSMGFLGVFLGPIIAATAVLTAQILLERNGRTSAEEAHHL